eukprot:214562-Chlamydomonas_euryale.AAC.2
MYSTLAYEHGMSSSADLPAPLGCVSDSGRPETASRRETFDTRVGSLKLLRCSGCGAGPTLATDPATASPLLSGAAVDAVGCGDALSVSSNAAPAGHLEAVAATAEISAALPPPTPLQSAAFATGAAAPCPHVCLAADLPGSSLPSPTLALAGPGAHTLAAKPLVSCSSGRAFSLPWAIAKLPLLPAALGMSRSAGPGFQELAPRSSGRQRFPGADASGSGSCSACAAVATIDTAADAPTPSLSPPSRGAAQAGRGAWNALRLNMAAAVSGAPRHHSALSRAGCHSAGCSRICALVMPEA